jgi:hypothetical protein
VLSLIESRENELILKPKARQKIAQGKIALVGDLPSSLVSKNACLYAEENSSRSYSGAHGQRSEKNYELREYTTCQFSTVAGLRCLSVYEEQYVFVFYDLAIC